MDCHPYIHVYTSIGVWDVGVHVHTYTRYNPVRSRIRVCSDIHYISDIHITTFAPAFVYLNK